MRRMRAQLLGKVAEKGCVPVALPTATYRYFAEPGFHLPSHGPWRRLVLPELPELAEQGAPWEWLEVELSVPAHRLGSLEQPNSHATHGQRGEPPAGAQP